MVLTSLLCVALTTYHEARSTSFDEQLLVSSSVYNRADNNATSTCTEAFKPKQYSWANNIKPKMKFASYKDMLSYYKINDINSFNNALAVAAVSQDYRNRQVTFYHDNTVKAKNVHWTKSMRLVQSTKNFKFYTNKS